MSVNVKFKGMHVLFIGITIVSLILPVSVYLSKSKINDNNDSIVGIISLISGI